MNPFATIGLSLLGGLGGFLGGGGGQKAIDPALLARLFGPNALAGDTQTLFNTLQASPAFAAMLNSASESGALAGQRTRANLARAGLGSSGVGALTSAVSRGFGTNLQLGARANLWNSALQAARENLGMRAGIWGQSAINAQNRPTLAQQFGQGLTGAAATGLTAMMAPRTPNGAAPAPSGAFTPTTSVVTAPMRRVGGDTVLSGGDPFDRRVNVAYGR